MVEKRRLIAPKSEAKPEAVTEPVPIVAAEPEPVAEPAAVAEAEADPVQWWHAPLRHPLSDDEFTTAYCNHVLATSNDPDLRIARSRAHKLVKHMHKAEIAAALAAYREEHTNV